jgi:hypothetical protein
MNGKTGCLVYAALNGTVRVDVVFQSESQELTEVAVVSKMEKTALTDRIARSEGRLFPQWK